LKVVVLVIFSALMTLFGLVREAPVSLRIVGPTDALRIESSLAPGEPAREVIIYTNTPIQRALAARVTAIGPTSQRVDGYIRWDQGGGVPFSQTNFSRIVAESNGIPTWLFMAGQAIGTGRITNDFFKTHYVSAPLIP